MIWINTIISEVASDGNIEIYDWNLLIKGFPQE